MEQTLNRCHRLLVAMKVEIENLSKVPQGERARAMAIMKINLVSYIQSIWPDRLAFEADIAALEAAQQIAAPDRAKIQIHGDPCPNCGGCDFYCAECYPPRG